VAIRIAVIGTRGIPGVAGGVESHCEELYPRLAKLGFEITIFGREPYIEGQYEYAGVHVVSVPTWRRKSLEAISTSWEGTRLATKGKFDILHYHSVGPAAVMPLARLMGAKHIVFTEHAQDYLQRKWGRVAKTFLRFGEWAGLRSADAVVSVSRHLQVALQERFHREVVYIPNGPCHTAPPACTPEEGYLDKMGLVPGEFVLYVGRLVPDKRVEDVIQAMTIAAPDTKLVIAGHTSHAWQYGAMLREMGGEHVVFCGWVGTEPLRELYANAAAFVLPSAVEGLPLSLIEAMGQGLPCVAADIPANAEVLGDPPVGLLHPVADVPAIAECLRRALTDDVLRARLAVAGPARVKATYDWDRIAEQVAEVYYRVLGRTAERPAGEGAVAEVPAR
jgi:glycosyltransferase involved in cell wall biosynthesis